MNGEYLKKFKYSHNSVSIEYQMSLLNTFAAMKVMTLVKHLKQWQCYLSFKNVNKATSF